MNRHNKQHDGSAKEAFHPAVIASCLSAFADIAVSLPTCYESKFACTPPEYPKISINDWVTSRTPSPVIFRGEINGSISENTTEDFAPMDSEEFRRIYLADTDEDEMQTLFLADMWQEVLDKKISKIKYFRVINELTQQALAEKLGLQQPNIARLEKLGYTPDIQTLKKLAKIFGIDYKELLD